MQRLPQLSAWFVAGLLGAGCSTQSPEGQTIIVAPAPEVVERIGTDDLTLAPTSLFVSRGSVKIMVMAGEMTYILTGPLLQGTIRATDINGFSDAIGEFDVISEGWRCNGCEPLIPFARETLFPTGRNPYLHVELATDATGMLTLEWMSDQQLQLGRFTPMVTGTPRNMTLELALISDLHLFSGPNKIALAEALGASTVEQVNMAVELHLTNDPVRAGRFANTPITAPVDDGDLRARGADIETRAALEGSEPTPAFVNESGR
jgi:hypothetical protein